MRYEFLTKEHLEPLTEQMERLCQQFEQMSILPTDYLMNDEQLARLFKVTTRTIKKWRADGKLDYVKVGSVVFTTKDAVLQFIEHHKITSQ